ncbi:hypothetical protein [Paracoccus benzoatiresistens]|uniref:Uncharacterized protein n=1 Tax=Paracoccus benzoatiresistens TaxID=2997341 RepID=A0ABT4J6X4_9RHOB|nr:hypothetical protein [Paracoccus sp. EF6]MCZ0962420.1 hypothetical protein [Paracoccus sp. EF6]
MRATAHGKRDLVAATDLDQFGRLDDLAAALKRLERGTRAIVTFGARFISHLL